MEPYGERAIKSELRRALKALAVRRKGRVRITRAIINELLQDMEDGKLFPKPTPEPPGWWERVKTWASTDLFPSTRGRLRF